MPTRVSQKGLEFANQMFLPLCGKKASSSLEQNTALIDLSLLQG